MPKFKIQHDVELSGLTTMKIGGKAQYFVEATEVAQLQEIFAWIKKEKLDYLILSGGSNTIFGDGYFKGVVVLINIKGFEVVEDQKDFAIIKIASGEGWDEAVAKTIELGLAGMEALSGIPGKTGAAPYQNIGAYGQEIKDTLQQVEVFDTESMEISYLSNTDCEFGYRDSVFKSSQKGRYIITQVYFKLSKAKPGVPDYKDVRKYFEERKISDPSLGEIRQAILEIRRHKFVDPSIMPNSGSFFKNPVVEANVAEELMKLYPEIKPFPQDNKIFPTPDGKYKVAAGWLIQELGFKGKDFGKVRVDPSHALVLENKDHATQTELLELVDKIRQAAKDKFGIDLEPEPVIVKF